LFLCCAAIFDRTGQYVITGSDDRLVKIWSTETGLCLRSCRGHEGDITDLAVSSGNTLVASASNDYSIRVVRSTFASRPKVEVFLVKRL
jgi:PH-interacting protein